VMSPGNYRFSDFLKLGSVVLVAYAVACTTMLWVLSGPLGWWG
jgi:di/tricarboxylate transporter